MIADLIDPAVLPDIYADGIAGVVNLGVCFRTVYFVWDRIAGEDGAILVRRPVACLVRPKDSILRRDGEFARMLAEQPDCPTIRPRPMRLHA